jgi:DNA-binding transcriptional MocR family regulator
MLKLNPWITAIEEEGAFAVLDKALALKAKGLPIINLGIGQPDFPPPAHVLEAAAKAARDGPHGYTSPIGIPSLREAVAAHVGGRYRVRIDPDQVVIVPGGKVTFYFACLLFGGPAAEILYPDPGFPPYREAIRSGGAKAVPYPIREERDFGFDAEGCSASSLRKRASSSSTRRPTRPAASSRKPRSSGWPPDWPATPTWRSCRTRSIRIWSSRGRSSRASCASRNSPSG